MTIQRTAFTVAVATDLIDRVRAVSNKVLCQDLLRTPHFGP